jgi:hypothetical protein
MRIRKMNNEKNNVDVYINEINNEKSQKPYIKKLFQNKIIIFISVCIIMTIIYCIFFRHSYFAHGPAMHYFHNGPAVLLEDGNVLIIGGNTKQAEIYNFRKNKFELVGEMNFSRNYGATTTLLKDGNVLITGGGMDFQSPLETEIYDIKSKKFKINSNMCIPRVNHTAISMDDGNILFFGGYDKKNKFVFEIEKFDYKTNEFNIISKIPNDGCIYYTAIPIEKNKVLLIGISSPIDHTKNNNPKKLLIYDYKMNKIYNFESKNVEPTSTQIYHTNIGLPTQMNNEERKNLIIIANYKDDITVRITIYASENVYNSYTIEDLGDELIIIGGKLLYGWGVKFPQYTEFFDKENQHFYLKESLIYKRYKHSSVKLPNGNILIFGGYAHGNEPQIDTNIYIK